MTTRNNTNDKGNRKNRREAPRRSRANPARERIEPVGEWEADVHATSRGPNRADMRRKVRTRGVKTIDVKYGLKEKPQNVWSLKLVDDI